jgi:hypothetical protein
MISHYHNPLVLLLHEAVDEVDDEAEVGLQYLHQIREQYIRDQ